MGELREELRAKEAVVREMSQNTNNTKLKELDTERKTYFDEVQRLQALLDQLVTSLSREAEETAREREMEEARIGRKTMTMRMCCAPLCSWRGPRPGGRP